ncbi:hypothetical protein ACQQ2Q_03590 [Agrobacterium sp. ES01]|uniref:hypothetical protein n=1 Tax=Agrobacterium sp. ES01 TaxID=3420714 RepID=UPI003D145CC9
MLMSRIALGLMLTLVASMASAANLTPTAQATQLAQLQMSQAQTGITIKEKTKPDREHGYQPRRYCIIDNDRFCRADNDRVGGVCRCSGMTGSGRVVVR